MNDLSYEETLLPSDDRAPVPYDRPPTFADVISEKDVAVPMRDGVNLSVDIYRPDGSGKFPALLAFSIYNKDLQGPDVASALPPQPAWSSLWAGLLEAGDTRFFVSRGYVHVIGSPRGIFKSDGGGSRQWDSYDLIEWIAKQPWCDGNVGMIRNFWLRRRATLRCPTEPATSKGDFSSRSAWCLRDDGELSRRVSWRSPAPLPILHHALCRVARGQRKAHGPASRQGSVMAAGDEQPGFQDVSACIQRARQLSTVFSASD